MALLAGAACVGIALGIGSLGFAPESPARRAASFSGVARSNDPPPDAYYPGCNEARAAGVAPLYVGEPGYREEMDGDGDGIACEPHR